MYNGMLNGDGIFNPSSGYINGDVYLQNGGSSYIQTPTVNIFGMSFTVELWLRIETLPASGSVVLFSQNDLILRINNNGRVTINAASPSSGTILGANKWYHVALVYTMTSEQQDIYVNGYLDSSSSQGLTSTANNSFFIGSSSGVGEYFVGEIDHLSIAARAKSACDILQDASLVASYSFSQGANASQDSGPNGFNGFISGTVNYVSSGAVGSALSFSGSSDYFQVIPSEIRGAEKQSRCFPLYFSDLILLFRPMGWLHWRSSIVLSPSHYSFNLHPFVSVRWSFSRTASTTLKHPIRNLTLVLIPSAIWSQKFHLVSAWTPPQLSSMVNGITPRWPTTFHWTRSLSISTVYSRWLSRVLRRTTTHRSRHHRPTWPCPVLCMAPMAISLLPNRSRESWMSSISGVEHWVPRRSMQ